MNIRSDQADEAAELFARPSYRERVEKRFMYVLVPCLVLNVVGSVGSHPSGFSAIWAAVSLTSAATVLAALLTLLVAMVPGRPRPVSRTGTVDRIA